MPAKEIIGFTVNVTLKIALPPAASVAVHVLVMIWSTWPEPGAVESVNVTVGVGSTASVAVAVPVAVGDVSPGDSTDMFGGSERSGAVVSCTVMI